MADSQKKSANVFNVTDYTNLSVSRNGGAENLTKTTDTISFDSGTSSYSGFYINNFTNAIDNYDSSQEYYITAIVTTDTALNLRWASNDNVIPISVGTNEVSFFGTVAGFICYTISTQAHVVVSKIMVCTIQHQYEPYGWLHSLRKLGTATETLTLPQTIYADGTNATINLKGNEEHTGTPSPQNPVTPNGVGELETSGEHAGQYKIPILSGGVTTNIYLGSTQSTRKVKKYVLTGQEEQNVLLMGAQGFFYYRIYSIIANNGGYALSTHYQTAQVINANMPDLSIKQTTTTSTDTGAAIIIKDTQYTTLADFKTYLQQQHTNGTPVTVWICLVDEQETTIDEPLMRLVGANGTVYADTLSNATSIPTTEGANTITVDTTVQPSEFTATWTGWHDSSVKEWDGTDWQ